MFPTPSPRDFTPTAAANRNLALAEQALAAGQLEHALPRALERFRRRLLRAALRWAMESLYNGVARGVEWYHATCGRIYLLTEDGTALRPIPRTAVRCLGLNADLPLDSVAGGFLARVCSDKEGDFVNDIDASGRGGRQKIDERARSELAVPLFDEDGPEAGKVIGIYHLASQHKGRFYPSQVLDVRRTASLLTMHLLVVRDWLLRRRDRPWVWHPEVHGWGPGRLMGRFCQAVARAAARPGDPLPSCSIWNADAKTGKCWTLATCGFDYDFLGLYALTGESAVGRVAAAGAGALDRGAPKDLGFQYLRKAREMGVLHAAIVALSLLDEHIRGTLNLYSLHVRTPVPTDRLLVAVAEQATRLLAALHHQRVSFAKAYIRGRLARSAVPQPDVRVLRKALTEILPVDALSIYVPGTKNGKRVLLGIDGPWRGKKRNKKPKKAWHPLDDPQERSISAHCFIHPGEVYRVNFGPDDEERAAQGLPRPSTKHPEAIDELDADVHHRRRLTVGVPAKEESGGEALGVIGMYRSAKKPPFTEADRDLLRRIAHSWECCGALFLEKAAHVYSPPQVLLGNRLQESINKLRADDYPKCRGSVFIHCDQAGRRLFRYVAYPHSWAPDDIRDESAGMLGIRGARKLQEDVTVLSAKAPDGQAEMRVCVPLAVWDGSHLVRALFTLDLGEDRAADDKLLEEAFQAAVEAGVFFAKSTWPPEVGLDGDLNQKLCDHVAKMKPVSGESRPEFLLERPVGAANASYRSRLDPELKAFQVRLAADGSECLIPLPVGPVTAAWLRCPLTKAFQERLDRVTPSARTGQAGAAPPSPEDEEAWRQLRRLVGLATGAWMRVVVIQNRLWKYVRFRLEREGEKACFWRATFRWPNRDPGRSS